MTNEELLAFATQFELLSYDKGIHHPRIHSLVIERRTYATDSRQSWAICDGMGWNLNHDGEWESERSPSNRENDFLKRCRWENLQEAITFAQEHMKTYPSGYKPETNET